MNWIEGWMVYISLVIQAFIYSFHFEPCSARRLRTGAADSTVDSFKHTFSTEWLCIWKVIHTNACPVFAIFGRYNLVEFILLLAKKNKKNERIVSLSHSVTPLFVAHVNHIEFDEKISGRISCQLPDFVVCFCVFSGLDTIEIAMGHAADRPKYVWWNFSVEFPWKETQQRRGITTHLHTTHFYALTCMCVLIHWAHYRGNQMGWICDVSCVKDRSHSPLSPNTLRVQRCSAANVELFIAWTSVMVV